MSRACNCLHIAKMAVSVTFVHMEVGILLLYEWEPLISEKDHNCTLCDYTTNTSRVRYCSMFYIASHVHSIR